MASIYFRKLNGRSIEYRHFRRSAPARIVGPGGIAGGGGASDRQFSSWARWFCRWRIPSLRPAMSADVDARQFRRCFRMNFLELGSSFSAVEYCAA